MLIKKHEKQKSVVRALLINKQVVVRMQCMTKNCLQSIATFPIFIYIKQIQVGLGILNSVYSKYLHKMKNNNNYKAITIRYPDFWIIH